MKKGSCFSVVHPAAREIHAGELSVCNAVVT